MRSRICERSHIHTAARPPAQSKTQSFPCKCTVWHPQLDPFEGNDRRFEGRRFPLSVHLTQPEKLAWPAVSSTPLSLRLRERGIHRSGRSLSGSPRLLPPASHCFYLISQPCCHGTEDGTSTLVLNDLLDDSLLVRHSCSVLLKCKTERNELLLLLEEGRGAHLTVLFWA